MQQRQQQRQDKPRKQVKRYCFFRANDIQDVDYKDIETLRRFLSSNMKIKPRRKTGLSAKYQRKVAKAIKQARIAGLLGFTAK
ncbi:MAG: 30S ribosomal protein S18 [Candidatus Magasanikbacteria bacterium GW2011_GWD2_43_18]|uniref:Small ribosomal subunit protein bS18 n=1 Tax=Candidatus Magasanikbacteria bacterium GW2011_GWE2_42_7 TaxID=1619052 RepID=A0A0G1DHX1_9BACT|nr:MAG: 30S ribosomal protein S18 [Candidatus Magasanikbacteria bacterium GW2011_GWC2_42_27]KKS70411.1 MAG: 30S ribosomal protein S18 [Candidatus Magasanikbacteria bacterium GW2011_GWE2_42_7]KKT04800.1 MAG: 30S ribosomal protein S18 [Candidatus Magasanikbacteria bacterium GW2011_GWD2_43_18]KKT25840.1 MAG: 30S ribosomal protein S18 [Candidatus Magasanikbacteria bacterium GW2011_GWA2_43_9]HBB37823.1 30S ribosomal protein S18 [Candidatus Magasanikbacteria bacterium]